MLKEAGMIQRNTTSVCGISRSFLKLDRKIPSLKWKRLFGAKYKQAEFLAVYLVAASGPDISAAVNALDVFNDLMLDAIFIKDATIGAYQLGNIGGLIYSSNSAFEAKYPATLCLTRDVHDKRLECHLSHPQTRRTDKPTGPIKYSYLNKAKRLLIASFVELKSNGLL